MAQSYAQKAPFNDWWYWSECLVKRLKTIGDIYRENDEPERSSIANEWSKRLKDNCLVPVVQARKGMKTDAEKAELKKLEETAIFNAAIIFREFLVNFPFMSGAIQEFLGVNWQDVKWDDDGADADEIDEDTGLPKNRKKKKSSGDQRVTELFWGPKQRQDEGIRSGKPEDGGLPGILANMVAAEKTSSSRSPTDYGQAMLASAAQQSLATTMAQAEKMGVQVNFKPGGGM